MKIRAPFALLLLGLTLTLAAYGVGLNGPFLFDDLPNIVENSRITDIDDQHTGHDLILAAFSSDSGPLKRPVSMLSFALNFHAFGMDPLAFKVVNLLIHALNGLSIYVLALLLLRQWPHNAAAGMRADSRNQLIAAAAAGLWLLHPMHVSSVLYVVQRMNELTTLFTLLGLIAYVHGRSRADLRGLLSALGGLVVFGLLAALSKENGLLIVVFALVIELCVLDFRSSSTTYRRLLLNWHCLTVGLPALAGTVYLLSHLEKLHAAFIPRDYSAIERLLTQSRVLWDYLGEILWPLPSRLGLYHDEIPISTSLVDPLITLPAVLSVLALLAWSVLQRARYPVAAFAILWFLAGHAVESTIAPLELKFEHRNYLPMFGIALAVVIVLHRLMTKYRDGALALVCASLMFPLAALSRERAYIWQDSTRFALSEAENHPHSARANYQAGLALAVAARQSGGPTARVPAAARTYFWKASQSNSTNALGSAGLVLSYAYEESVPAALVEDLNRRLREMRNPQDDAVKDIVNAQMRGQLALSPGQIIEMLQSILENPYAKPITRATILNKLGEYHFNKLHDPQAAVSLTIAATQEDPGNPLFQVNLASLALILDRPDIAKLAIAKAEQLDAAQLWTEEIGNIRSQLREFAVSNQPGASDH